MTDDANRITRAGNYVLGLMDDHDRERAERDLEIDPAFRDAVVMLAERMHVFDRTPAADQAPEGDWKRLTQHIADMPQMRSKAPDPSAAAAARRRSDKPRQAITPAAPKPRRIALHRIPGWRAALMAASLVAAWLAGYLGGEAIRKVSPPRAVAVLTAQADAAGAVVAFADGAIRIAPFGDIELPEGKVLQLWTVYDEAAGPVLLATLERSKEVLLAGDHPSPKPGQFYQITLEPSPGSPTGKPTGPVVASGTVPGG